LRRRRLAQNDGAAVSDWLESYAEVGATLVVYGVSVARSPLPSPAGDHRVIATAAATRHHDNATYGLHAATYHDAILALYQCARARWLATSGDSCQCMTGRDDDFLSTLSNVSTSRCWLLLQTSRRSIYLLTLFLRLYP